MRMGWFREVHIKSEGSYRLRMQGGGGATPLPRLGRVRLPAGRGGGEWRVHAGLQRQTEARKRERQKHEGKNGVSV